MTKTPPSFFCLSVKPWGLFTAAGVIACVATVVGFFGRTSWFLDLFSHFRVQYFLGLLLLGVLLLVGRRRRTATVFLILASVNLAMVLPLYFGKPYKPTEASPAMRAMLLNVNTRRGDANRVKSVISDADPDILVLEEISASWMSDLAWLTNSYPHSLAQPREDNFGIGLFSKLPLAEAKVVYIGEAEVPSIIATVIAANTNLLVIATHPLPPGGRDYSRWRNDQLEKLPDYVQSPLPTLLLGDLNVTPWNYHFRRLLTRTGLRDSAKGFGVQPTWPNYNPLLRIPIDHCLHSAGITVVDRRIGEGVSSDHYPVIVDFAIGKKQADGGPTR
jgi:endonuclease/exonuclease/phosphatase (EEP) superfamily protein YafD